MSSIITSPSSEYYKRSEKCNTWAKFFLLIASILIAFSLLLPDIYVDSPCWYYTKLTQVLSVVAYQMLTMASALNNFKGRRVRINDLVDNSFGSNHSDIHSICYYDNDETSKGVYRYYLNTVESCFFSMREMEYMQKSVYTKAASLLLLLIVALFLRNTDFILSIFQITVLFTIIINTLKFIVVFNELQKLFGRMETALKKKSNIQQTIADAINYSLEYETILAWYCTKLPDKIYNKYNACLTNEWNNRKKQYTI